MSEPVENPGGRYEDIRTGQRGDEFYCGTCGAFLGTVLADVRAHELRDCVAYLAGLVSEMGRPHE